MSNIGAATAGNTLIGAGTGAIPVFASIGTNSGLTAHGLLIGEGNSAFSSTSAGSSGQVMQSGGASADPSYSTATYPSTTTINQILYSSAANTVAGLATANRGVLTTGATGVPAVTALATNGQIIIGSTAGAPAAANITSTGGTVTITNGSNSINLETPSSVILNSSGVITNAQIKAMHATPVQMAAAPGSGKYIRVICFTARMNYGGTNVFTAGAAQSIAVYYGTTSTCGTALSNAQLVSASSQAQAGPVVLNVQGAYTLVDNLAVNFWQPVATEITGNAANDNTISYSFTYQVVS